ncbi:LysR substrate-binding domain-containing protein, partial [Stenotrophomonas maltophilia]|uniref:LysR substrate-binding domain-containing protein n=1 Tax=Stenotrophomonas maltophilia TaxID=40324 RepID=UPI003CFDA5FE
MGVRLLQRTTRRVNLTEHGARFLQRVRGGLDQIDQAFAELDSARSVPAGRLRVTLPRIVADRMVLPRLPDFLARYPQVQVELCVDPALTDLVAEGFDAGIRLGEALSKDMIAVRVGPDWRLVVVASPAYFDAHPKPKKPADITRHRCINIPHRPNGSIYAWEFEDKGKEFSVRGEG